MDKLIMAIVILIVLAALALIAWQIFSTANPKPADASGKVLLMDLLNTIQRKGGTIACKAPVIYFQMPEEKKAKMVQLKYARTVIGSGKSCDIVLDHPSVSRRHAEIYLAVKRQYIFWGEEARFFVLKNISKTNPVEFYVNDSDSKTPFKMITKSIPLKEEENFFYMGDIKVKVVNPLPDNVKLYSGKTSRNTLIFGAGSSEEEIIRREYEQKLRRSKGTSRLL